MGDENHAYFLESRGRKIRRKRKIKLLKHIIALYSPLALKNVLARYVRSIAFILQSEMPACNVTLPVMGETQKLTLYELKIYVLVFLMLLSLTASFKMH